MLHGMETVLKRDLWPLTRETSLFLTPSTLGRNAAAYLAHERNNLFVGLAVSRRSSNLQQG